MKIESVADLKPNWKITKATNETLAKIYLDHHKRPITKKMVNYFAETLNRKKASNIKREIGEILRTYKGIFKKDLQIIETHNLVPNVLRNQLATLLTGEDVPSSFKANYVAL